MTFTKEPGAELPLQQQDSVVIRFAGDSGDGMQITGNQFTSTSAVVGNDLATLPDFPAEIRAPAGTRPGVSGFQLCFSSKDIHTPGDAPDVLVAMNPAALVVNIADLKPGGIVVVNTGNFAEKDLKKAKLDKSPLTDGSLDGFRVIEVDINKRVTEALKGSPLSSKEVQRCKNFYTLGLMYWLYSRPVGPTEEWLRSKFGKEPQLADANITAMRAGYNAGDIHELFQARYEVRRCTVLPAGTYRNIMGNQAVALGLVAGAELAGLRPFLGSYPITPASTILEALAALKNYEVYTFQAEDEIAAICSALGASFAGYLGMTSTSGPGMALKSEAMGLAVSVELHRERLGAVEAARHRLTAARPRALPHRARGLHALLARRQGGAPVGEARHRGPGAPRRRPREGAPHRQRLLRRGQPRVHGARAAGEGDGHPRHHPDTASRRTGVG